MSCRENEEQNKRAVVAIAKECDEISEVLYAMVEALDGMISAYMRLSSAKALDEDVDNAMDIVKEGIGETMLRVKKASMELSAHTFNLRSRLGMMLGLGKSSSDQ